MFVKLRFFFYKRLKHHLQMSQLPSAHCLSLSHWSTAAESDGNIDRCHCLKNILRYKTNRKRLAFPLLELDFFLFCKCPVCFFPFEDPCQYPLPQTSLPSAFESVGYHSQTLDLFLLLACPQVHSQALSRERTCHWAWALSLIPETTQWKERTMNYSFRLAIFSSWPHHK